MPSEERVQGALAALEPARIGFQERVSATAGEVRAWLSSRDASSEERARRLARELGFFALGRIDARRLAGLLPHHLPVGADVRDVVGRALEILDGIAAEGEEAFLVDVPPGGDLRDAVRGALAERGRAFGAARVVELARSERYQAEEHLALLDRYPFRRWSAAERAAAPPLVVRVRGEDLQPAGLGELLQGRVKVALVVAGAAPPAALARLISPGVWVAQSTSVEAVALLGAIPGAGVIGVFDPAEAPAVVVFVHDPAGGAHAWERISLSGDPEELIERAAAGAKRGRSESALEELAHLLSLAEPPEAAGSAQEAAEDATGADEPTPADRLAAWLLARTDLDEG